MEPIYREKRNVVVYIPYRLRNSGDYEFYLQKRDINAPTHAGIFSMFGGGIDERETMEDALLREVKEELRYIPKQHVYLTRNERSKAIFHVFIEEVTANFEEDVEVFEGEYGKFLTVSECALTSVSAIAMLAITDTEEWLRETAGR